MDNYQLANTVYGWIIGNFEPSLLKTDQIEVGVKTYNKYQYKGQYFRNTGTEIFVITEGKVRSNGKIYGENDILVFHPKEVVDFMPLEQTKATVIRFPIVKNDTSPKIPGYTFADYDQFLNRFVNEVGSEEQLSYLRNLDIKISPSDITVLVQGPVDDYFTKMTMESIRKYLPGSKILFSTWKGENVEGLNFDEVLFSDDPGAVECPDDGRSSEVKQIIINNYNLNRQLISIQQGLMKIKSKYTLKLRSDMILFGNEFLKLYDRFDRRDKKYRFFQTRVLTCDLNSLKYYDIISAGKRRRVKTPFYISDYFYFGLTDDLKLYFLNTNLASQQSKSDLNKKQQHNFNGWDLAVEQYYCISALSQKFDDVKMKDVMDSDDKTVELSCRYSFNNFLPLSILQSRILSLKHIQTHLENNGASFVLASWTFDDFMEKYRNN